MPGLITKSIVPRLRWSNPANLALDIFKIRQAKLTGNILRNTAGLKRVFASPPLESNGNLRGGRLKTWAALRPLYIVLKEKRFAKMKPPPAKETMKPSRSISHSYIQIVSTPTADTPGTTLMLHFDDRRYIFGHISEGTQRACVERKFSMMKVEDMFLTGKVDWATTGGLFGMILTLADLNTTKNDDLRKAKSQETMSPELRIHGGRNLTHMVATARKFIFRKGIPLYIHEIHGSRREKAKNLPVWNDSNIKVWSMVTSPGQSPQSLQKSPRKRTSDEISGDGERPVDLDGVVVRETSEEREDRYDQMRKAVVNHMFGSSWSLDALSKTPLSEVKMPATIFVRDSEGKIKKYEGPMPGTGQPVPDIDVLVRKPWPGANIENLPPTKPSQTVLSYFVRGHSQRGKFDAKKAIALGVKAGPNFGILTNGCNVQAEDGKTITPDMVMGPPQLGGGFAMIDIPSSDYIESTLNNQEWEITEIVEGIDVIVWILGAGVKVDGKMEQFMIKHSQWKHMVSSPDYGSNYLSLQSAAASAIRLHQIDPDHFPIPTHSNASPVQWSSEVSGSSRPFEHARIGQKVGVYPRTSIQNENVVQHLDTASVVGEASPDLLSFAARARQEVSSPEFLTKLEEQQKDIPSKDAEVITLGTGSALPSKYRNVSATLVCVPGYGNYLLDCGENTIGQMKRVFGAQLPTILQNLKMIWISHLHADHHLGTASVIREWHRATENLERHKKDRLLVASDQGMLKWLEEYSSVEDYGYNRIDILSLSRENNYMTKFAPEQVNTWGLKSIAACPVHHCHGALAVAIEFPNGFKVAYSGDCRPSNDFVRVGKGATLLIHEATFDDEMQSDALAKKHSTTGEAIDIGKRMGAQRILLTHFSQRYQKIPIISDEGGSGNVKAGVAFDYMKVKVGDIAKLEAFRPALLKLFEKELEEVEEQLVKTNSRPLPTVTRDDKKSKRAAKKMAKAQGAAEPRTD